MTSRFYNRVCKTLPTAFSNNIFLPSLKMNMSMSDQKCNNKLVNHAAQDGLFSELNMKVGPRYSLLTLLKLYSKNFLHILYLVNPKIDKRNIKLIHCDFSYLCLLLHRVMCMYLSPLSCRWCR